MSEYSQKPEPMNQKLLQWAKDNREDFKLIGISLEIVDPIKEIEGKKLQNPAQVVFFDSKRNMGQICVWMSGMADMEILNDKGESKYYSHHDDIRGKDFKEIFQEFLHNLCE